MDNAEKLLEIARGKFGVKKSNYEYRMSNFE
jgi:hypothetical protein